MLSLKLIRYTKLAKGNGERMIGLTFKLNSEATFEKILHLIVNKEDKSLWIVDCLWIEGPANDHIGLTDKILTADKMTALFSSIDAANFVYFARLRRYNSISGVDEIKTWNDYISSECSMILFVSDAYFCEIYGKNNNEICEIKNIVAHIGADDIADENEDSRSRSIMLV